MIDNSYKLRGWVESLTPTQLDFLLRYRTIYKDNCWLFQGANIQGYGVMSKYNLTYLVHRLSSNVYHKLPYDSKLKVLHKIECPNHNCWNPDHLYEGTQKDNMNDSMILGNNVNSRFVNNTHCRNGHELTPDNIYNPKGGSLGGKNINSKGRWCKLCIKIKNANYWKRKKEHQNV